MVKIRYEQEQSKYDVPAGTYIIEFRGTRDKPPFKESKFGNSDEPRLGWEFVIVGPPTCGYLGKIIEQATGTYPSAKSGLVRLINLLMGGTFQPGMEIDTQQFIGRQYQVLWAINPASESGNLHISSLMAVGTTPAPQAPAGPPPRKPAVAPAAITVRKFWVIKKAGTDAVEMDDLALQTWIGEEKMEPSAISCVPVGESEWKTAADYGFQGTIPY
jgi:hypothetical protein